MCDRSPDSNLYLSTDNWHASSTAKSLSFLVLPFGFIQLHSSSSEVASDIAVYQTCACDAMIGLLAALMQVVPKTHKMCKYFHLLASFDCSINIKTKEALFHFCFEINIFSGCSVLGSIFTNEEQKKVGSLKRSSHILALFMTTLTQTAGHKLGSTHGHVFLQL